MPDEFCPNCGKFVDQLNDLTGFCGTCSVGVLQIKTPTRKSNYERLELWLYEHADIIEDEMVSSRSTAKEAIKTIVLSEKVYCRCCGEVIPRATYGRHFLCRKNPICKKAQRYYVYLVHEKNIDKDKALAQALKKYRKQARKEAA